MADVSVLFARADSCYFDLAADVWDEVRDARGYRGTNPVVAHPPCRAWGRLSHLAKPSPGERELAIFAIDQLRRVGGVLEHPHASKLWRAMDLPCVGEFDAWGGFTLLVDQGWWGHAAPKPTWLYVVGVERSSVPPLPVQLHRAAGRTMDLSVRDREATPPAFARWLVDLAALAVTPSQDYAVTSSCREPLLRRAGRRGSYTDLADVLIG